MFKKTVFVSSCIAASMLLTGCSQTLQETDPQTFTQLQNELGQQLFFDPILSKNKTQSCSTCHNPEHAFIDNRENSVKRAGSLGDDGHSIGDRNTPTASYAMFSPPFHYDKNKKQFIGGQFWDGRAATLKEQAKGPPLNPVEMNMHSSKQIMQRIIKNPLYKKRFIKLYGQDIFEDEDRFYDKLAQAIAAFESTEEFAPFDSKYDRFLKGEYELTPLEDLGRSLFFSNNNTSCASCHVLKKEDSPRDTFTNYRYHNIGTPKNLHLMEKNVVDKNRFIDHGLLNNPQVKKLKDAKKYDGKMKVPTLRNVAVTGPYMHNGVFEKLSTVVAFYDKYTNQDRTINPETGKPWAEPEVEVSKEDLKLLQQGRAFNQRKIDALVAFMNLLTDKRYEHLIKEDN